MVTLHKIPCSYCGKIVERYVYCSGACKVHGHRERKGGRLSVTVEPSVKQDAPKVVKSETTVSVKSSSSEPMFSDKKKEGYHYSEMLGKYVKDD